jgi:hypothetical protein
VKNVAGCWDEQKFRELRVIIPPDPVFRLYLWEQITSCLLCLNKRLFDGRITFGPVLFTQHTGTGISDYMQE